MAELTREYTLSRVTGEIFSARILFFITDIDGAEYMAFDDGGTIIKAARLKKGATRWRVEELWGDHPIFENINELLHLATVGASRVTCGGETYILKVDKGEVYYIKRPTNKTIFKKLDKPRRGLRVYLVACMLVFAFSLGGLAANHVFNAANANKTETTYRINKTELPSGDEYIAYIAQHFAENAWSMYEHDERLAVLQSVCDWETLNVLGSSAAKLETQELDENSLAYYSKDKGIITLNREFLMKNDRIAVLETIIHESRHVWQRDMIELLSLVEKNGDDLPNLNIFDNVKDFRRDWINYTSGLEDFDTYYEQTIERDSRDWAAERMIEYYLPIIIGF